MPPYRSNTPAQPSIGRRPGNPLASRSREDFSPDPPSDPPHDQERENGQPVDECLHDIIEVIKGNKQVQKCSPHAQELRTQARWIYRLLGPAADLHTVFRYGPYCVDTDDDLPELPDYSQEFLDKLKDTERAKLGRQYLSLFDIIPALPEFINYFSSTEALWRQFLKHLSSHADAGRRDDIKNIKGGVLHLMPRESTDNAAQAEPQAEPQVTVEQHLHPGPPSEEDPFSLVNKTKESRGFNHISTGRLLCPRAMLSEFDADQLSFRSAVIEGRRSLEAGDFMTFLYGDEYSETDLEHGLFRSPFLMKVFRFIFTGKTSATKSKPGPSSVGRPSLAVAAKRVQVIPEMIAWAAVMAYYALCSQSTWSLQDGNVSLSELWDLIMELFEDRGSKWATETLQWWNLNVWGSWAVKIDTRHQQRTRQTTAEKLAEQRAARRASSTASW